MSPAPVAFTDVQDSIVGLEAQVSAIRDLIAHENEQVVALEVSRVASVRDTTNSPFSPCAHNRTRAWRWPQKHN